MNAVSQAPASAATTNIAGRWINLALISGAWGSSFLFVKLISPLVPPFAFAAQRGAIAMAALLLWLAVRNPPHVVARGSRRVTGLGQLTHMVVLGTTNGWLANVLTAVAVRHLSSGVVGMGQAAVPLMVGVLAHFVFAEEKFTTRQFVGILTGLFGILLIVGPLAAQGDRSLVIGVGAMLLVSFSYACGTVYGRCVAGIDPVILACGQQGVGALIAAAISVQIESHLVWDQPISVWLLLAAVGIVCSALPTALYLSLLGRTKSVVAAFVAYLQPVWATLLGWAVLGEKIGLGALVGTALVFIAVAVSTRRDA